MPTALAVCVSRIHALELPHVSAVLRQGFISSSMAAMRSSARTSRKLSTPKLLSGGAVPFLIVKETLS